MLMTVGQGEFSHEPPMFEVERQLVYAAHGVEDPSMLDPEAAEWLELQTLIAAQFSRINPETYQYETISPSRVAAITPITIRHMQLLYPARGRLTNEDIRYSWQTNMPANDGMRHPDLLFDIAQINFGTDEPVDYIERQLMHQELERRSLTAKYRSTVHAVLAQMRFRGEVPEEVVDELVEEARGWDPFSN